MQDIKVSFLVLDFRKEIETRICLESIKKHALFQHKVVYLDNGGFEETYPDQLYQEGLCDVLIRKRNGYGGGYGQTDLIRYCDTKYFIFVQNDQELIRDIHEGDINYCVSILDAGEHCVDLNGDQSRRGVWTDRAHLMKTEVFNSLSPFPNGGPGLDDRKWNEQYLQEKFKELNYSIIHLNTPIFKDCGKWSIREAGDGLFKHRCDLKTMYIVKKPTYRTNIYPPFTDDEWDTVLKGEWVNGTIPEKWKEHSFRVWPD